MTIPARLDRRLRSFTPAFFLFCLLAVLPAQASASDGYAQLWGALNLANANAVSDNGQWGPGAQIGARVGITDFWSIVGGVEGSYHFAETEDDIPSSQVLGLFGGFRYNLDVFQYVPYVGLAIENFVIAPPDAPGVNRAAVGGKFSLGLDWRYSRNWSLGGMIELHAPLTDPGDFPIYSTIGANLAYHFRL
ncbi:porin family protein [Persicimonas caeni]|uniref:Porin family protein n=1 Tax=Persicimonas caeni TaxID=2292766 RepID=A0A4Y6Q1K2_PERCE|nr:outer membrane beta-barrel protein [Persicimonas caeni]QDG54474.1 porin family protein [Persicimonas caeni]QED35695.1 porin family protein [Persicimonas caeni]